MSKGQHQYRRFANSSGHDEELLAFLVREARRILCASHVVLFGSRARGDHGSRSDYDVAFVVAPEFRDQWPLFRETVQEDAPTLHALDLILLDDAVAPDLRAAIERDGVLLYGPG